MKLSQKLYELAEQALAEEKAAAAELCAQYGHIPAEMEYLIDRGMTYEGVDYYGCRRCKIHLSRRTGESLRDV